MKLDTKQYKLIGSVVAIVFLLVGMLLSELNIIGKDGIEISIDSHSRFELQIKNDMTIKSSVLYNEEGGMVTKKLNLSSRTMKEAIGILGNVMLENDMLGENNEIVLVGVINHEKDIDSEQISNEVSNILNDVFSHAVDNGTYKNKIGVYSSIVDGNDKRLKQISKEFKVSMAKGKIMQQFHRALGGHTMRELSAMPMQEMVMPLVEKNIVIK